jgi:predicted transposase YdaD
VNEKCGDGFRRRNFPAPETSWLRMAAAFTGESMGPLFERRLRKDGFIDKWTAGSRAEGRAEGIAKGIAEGIAEGHAEGIVEMARKMLLHGMQLEEIAKITGFSATEMRNLR